MEMNEEQKPVALIDLNGEFLGYAVGGKLINKKDDVDAKHAVWIDEEGVIVGNNEGGTARPLYLHPAPAVVKQLVEALESLLNDVGRANSMLGAVKARAALVAAKEAGLW